jgi:hypothetical protein
VALARAEVALPDADVIDGDETHGAVGAFWNGVATQAAVLAGRHEVIRVDVSGLDEALRKCPVPLSTMGRGLDDDYAAFLASACAGRLAAGD